MYFCETCKSKRKCIKKIYIYRFPKILVVHIKRFRYSTFSRQKLSTDVSFPIEGLDLSPFMSPDSVNGQSKSHIPQESTILNINAQLVLPVVYPNPSVSASGSQLALSGHMVPSECDLSTEIDFLADTQVDKDYTCNASMQLSGTLSEPLYNLLGVSHHSGSLSGGHYISHVDTNAGRGNARWMCFNDDRVSQVNPASVHGPSAYILFYRLQT